MLSSWSLGTPRPPWRQFAHDLMPPSQVASNFVTTLPLPPSPYWLMYSYSDTGSSCPPGEAGRSWASFRTGVPLSHQDGTAHGGAHQEEALWGGVDCTVGVWDTCGLSLLSGWFVVFNCWKTTRLLFLFPWETHWAYAAVKGTCMCLCALHRWQGSIMICICPYGLRASYTQAIESWQW